MGHVKQILAITILVLGLAVTAAAQATIRISGIAGQGGQAVQVQGQTSSTKVIRSYPGATVSVFAGGTTNLVLIYSDASLTPKSNPFTSSVTDASFFFYAVAGRYDITFSGAGIASPFTVADVFVPVDITSSVVNVKNYGAIADGGSHPLSGFYGTLAAAKVTYPFITSLSQEMDYAALKQASNVAFGPDFIASGIGTYQSIDPSSTTTSIVDNINTYTPASLIGQTLYLRYPNGFVTSTSIVSNTAHTIGVSPALPFDFHTCPGQVCTAACSQPDQAFPCSQYALGTGNTGEHGGANARLNKQLYIPGGIYFLGNDTWLIRNLVGGRITGIGRQSVIIESNSWAFQTDGLWYSTIEGVTFQTLTSTAGHGAADIDGNVPGHPYTTRSVQQNTFREVGFNGGESTYGSALNRQGGSSAQGENLYENCNWISATVAYFQNGFNALNDVILRGDMQDYTTGVYIIAGSVHIFGTTMESTRGYAQITDTSFAAQGGFDIDASSAGVGEAIVVQGVRSESLRFYRGSGSQVGVLIGNLTSCGGCTVWSANGAVTSNQIVHKTSVSAGEKIYRVTTPGTSGNVEPTWPNSGTVADGTAVWTETEYNVVDATTSGYVNWIENNFQTGNLNILNAGTAIYRSLSLNSTREIQANYTASIFDETLLVDATGGSRTITLPFNNGTSTAPIGKRYIIKKYDTSANTVTVQDDAGSGPDGAAAVIPGGSRGYLVVELGGGGSLTRRYWIVSKSF